jgi:hypothetical protein
LRNSIFKIRIQCNIALIEQPFPANADEIIALRGAEKALAILDAHVVSASSWADTDQYRGEIRRSAQKTLKQLSAKQG